MSVKCSGPDLSTRCVKTCPIEKSYFITDNNVCDFCSTNCLRCEKNATKCTACRQGLKISISCGYVDNIEGIIDNCNYFL